MVFMAADVEMNMAVDDLVIAEDLARYLLGQFPVKLFLYNVHELCKKRAT